MIVVRGTKRFLDRVGRPALGEVSSDGPLGDWYANVWPWGVELALFVSERSLFPVVVPLAPVTTVIERFAVAFGELARVLDVDATPEIEAMNEFALARTASRSVVGIMNEFAHLADYRREHDRHIDLVELSVWLARTPCSPLYRRSISPDREVAALLRRPGASPERWSC
jgi:hypothetical protein